MKTLAETAAVVFLATSALSAQDKKAAAIVAADKAWADAVTKTDTAALEKLLADDLVYTHSTGLIDTKRQYIDNLKSGAQQYHSVTHLDPKVQVYGDTAVLTSGLKMDTTSKGARQQSSFRLIHVWVKKPVGWQLIAHQTTRLP
ncbi:MAG: nuclear transport factor 2 family protein [Bryobacteraceae bacterium]|nr:nuclear transport factor 2 family protein [Bryobacteraceae bacterium]